MKLPTEVFGDVVVVHTPEEIGADTAANLEQFLTSQERNNVIVDLDGSETIDSGGLEALLTAQEAALRAAAQSLLNKEVISGDELKAIVSETERKQAAARSQDLTVH